MAVEVVVEYEYKATEDDELTLKVGDVITNVIKQEGGWWKGELNGTVGVFPDNFVKEIKHSSKEANPSNKESSKSKEPNKKPAGHIAELANKLQGDGLKIGQEPPVSRKQDSAKRKVRANVVYSYQPDEEDELQLKEGDVINVLKQEEEGWWQGELNGKIGMFPSNFVELIQDEDSKSNQDEKEDDNRNITGKKVIGVGLGNIFNQGPIVLRQTTSSTKPAQSPQENGIAKDNSDLKEAPGPNLPSKNISSKTPASNPSPIASSSKSDSSKSSIVDTSCFSKDFSGNSMTCNADSASYIDSFPIDSSFMASPKSLTINLSNSNDKPRAFNFYQLNKFDDRLPSYMSPGSQIIFETPTISSPDALSCEPSLVIENHQEYSGEEISNSFFNLRHTPPLKMSHRRRRFKNTVPNISLKSQPVCESTPFNKNILKRSHGGDGDASPFSVSRNGFIELLFEGQSPGGKRALLALQENYGSRDHDISIEEIVKLQKDYNQVYNVLTDNAGEQINSENSIGWFGRSVERYRPLSAPPSVRKTFSPPRQPFRKSFTRNVSFITDNEFCDFQNNSISSFSKIRDSVYVNRKRLSLSEKRSNFEHKAVQTCDYEMDCSCNSQTSDLKTCDKSEVSLIIQGKPMVLHTPLDSMSQGSPQVNSSNSKITSDGCEDNDIGMVDSSSDTLKCSILNDKKVTDSSILDNPICTNSISSQPNFFRKNQKESKCKEINKNLVSDFDEKRNIVNNNLIIEQSLKMVPNTTQINQQNNESYFEALERQNRLSKRIINTFKKFDIEPLKNTNEKREVVSTNLKTSHSTLNSYNQSFTGKSLNIKDVQIEADKKLCKKNVRKNSSLSNFIINVKKKIFSSTNAKVGFHNTKNDRAGMDSIRDSVPDHLDTSVSVSERQTTLVVNEEIINKKTESGEIVSSVCASTGNILDESDRNSPEFRSLDCLYLFDEQLKSIVQPEDLSSYFSSENSFSILYGHNDAISKVRQANSLDHPRILKDEPAAKNSKFQKFPEGPLPCSWHNSPIDIDYEERDLSTKSSSSDCSNALSDGNVAAYFGRDFAVDVADTLKQSNHQVDDTNHIHSSSSQISNHEKPEQLVDYASSVSDLSADDELLLQSLADSRASFSSLDDSEKLLLESFTQQMRSDNREFVSSISSCSSTDNYVDHSLEQSSSEQSLTNIQHKAEHKCQFHAPSIHWSEDEEIPEELSPLSSSPNTS